MLLSPPRLIQQNPIGLEAYKSLKVISYSSGKRGSKINLSVDDLSTAGPLPQERHFLFPHNVVGRMREISVIFSHRDTIPSKRTLPSLPLYLSKYLLLLLSPGHYKPNIRTRRNRRLLIAVASNHIVPLEL